MDFSVQEENIVRQSLAMRAIPSQKLLIKYYKKINEKGGFSTRLVILATNFTAIFSKIVYIGIKMMLDKEKVKYSCVSVVQASDLKEGLGELEVNRDKVTIASVDAINMYPSIKLSTIKNSLRLFARKITLSTNKIVNIFLDLIHFEMSSTLISFNDEYYE